MLMAIKLSKGDMCTVERQGTIGGTTQKADKIAAFYVVCFSVYLIGKK